MKSFFRSLFDRTVFPVMLVVSCGLVLSTLVAYFHAKTTVETLAVGRLDQNLFFLDKSVSSRINDVIYQLNLWTKEDVFRFALEDSYLGRSAREAATRRLSARLIGGAFNRINLANRRGEILAGTDPGVIGAFTIADREYFKRAIRGEVFIETISSGRFNGLPILIIAAPVKNENGAILGVLLAIMETASFGQTMLEGVRPGEADSAYILNPEGKTLAHAGGSSDFDVPAKTLVRILNASDKTEDMVVSDNGPDRIVMTRKNPLTGWILALEADAQEVMRPASHLAALSAAISAGTILLVVFFLGALRKAIKDLRRSERKARTLTEASPVGILTLSDNGALTYMNSWARRIFGLNQGGKATLPDTLPLENKSGEAINISALAFDAASVDGGIKTGLFAWGIARGGDKRALILNVARLSPSEAVVTMEDDTDRRLSEDRLRQSEEKLSRIFDLAPECILITRVSDGIVLRVNSFFEKLTGYSQEALEGKSPLDLNLWFEPKDRTVLYEMLRRDEKVDDFAFKMRANDGRVRQCLVSSRLLHLSGELCALNIIRDVTEQVQMREVMIQTEKMLSVGGLAAGMAHELNNPLGVISMSTQNLERRLSVDNPKNRQAALECDLDLDNLAKYMEKRGVDDFFKAIHEASGRAAKIIRSMLHFSQSRGSGWGACDVNVLMDQALELAMNEYDPQRGFDLRKIAIFKNYAVDLPSVPCKDTELTQVLLNLIKNATQTMSVMEPGKKPELTVATRQHGDVVRIMVSDNGPGMKEEVRKRVFEPFFTTKAPGEGTGLGLSVSYFIITQKHGGRIYVESEPGRGASFIVELPIEKK